MQAANVRERERFGTNIGHNQHEYMLHFINLLHDIFEKAKATRAYALESQVGELIGCW